jgi:molybdate transport system ATP-binding protein
VSLSARLRVERGAFCLDAELDAGSGEVVAVLGPNGAGKSTCLRALAGLQPLDGGQVRLDGAVLEDVATGVRIPPEERGVGMVFQDHLLFGHLDAVDNVAFGLRCRGVGRRRSREVALDWLGRVGLASSAGSRPAALSGGQAQRVALARALAFGPRLLLLDEPLAALDARTRQEVRAALGRHLGAYDGAAVLVSHDPVDALVLADRIVVLEEGRVVQAGSPQDVARHPRTDYVARLMGLNLFRGTAGPSGVRLDAGPVLSAAEQGSGRVLVAIAPSAVSLHRRRPEGSPRNVLSGTVEAVELVGERARVALAGPLPLLVDVTPAAVADLGLAPGTPVWAAVKATELRVYPA